MQSARGSNQNGFTLVEVLVALVVTALLLTITMGGAITARERMIVARQKRAAAFVANSAVERALTLDYQPKPQSGAVAGLNWKVTETMLRQDPRGFFGLIAIRVSVSDRSGRMLFRGETRRVKSLSAT